MQWDSQVFAIEPSLRLKSSVGAQFEMTNSEGEKEVFYVRIKDVWVELLLNRVGPNGRKVVCKKDSVGQTCKQSQLGPDFDQTF